MKRPWRAFFSAALIFGGCTSNRFTVCTGAEARDIATAALNARLAGKMWRSSDGAVHACRTHSPADWAKVSIEADVWRLVLRQTDGAPCSAVVTIDRRSRATEIVSCNCAGE